MERRDFLKRGGLALGAAALGTVPAREIAAPARPAVVQDPKDWAWVRSQFDLLDPSWAHFDGFFLTSHPKAVRAAIEKHRAALDLNPMAGLGELGGTCTDAVRAAAAEYTGTEKKEIALTGSTTMGLAILYSGIKLRPDQEILTSPNDHPWATAAALRLREQRNGTKIVTLPSYADSSKASVDEIVGTIVKNLTPKTRVLATTFVHSCTGVKMPIRAVTDAVATVNRGRDAKDRVIVCVDGVHGFGIEDVTLPGLGCDFFAAGTHKWIFGPRGTGILWGRADVWSEIVPMIPAFGRRGDDSGGFACTPGGFHSFEYRWALAEAFKLHLAIGKARVQERIHALNRQIREGLAKMPHVELHTPLSDALASGIVCFDVKGKTPSQVIDGLEKKRIAGSVSPYTPSCARLAASLWNTPEQVEHALAAIAAMA
jgi:selenocysteine lyase/cysteine desulfurase